MPELNPYEPPQTESKPTPGERSLWSTRGSLLLDWIVPLFIGMQFISGVSWFVFDFMQAMAHSVHQQLQAIAVFFAASFVVLGFLVFLIEVYFGSMKVVIFEVLVLVLFIWKMTQIVH